VHLERGLAGNAAGLADDPAEHLVRVFGPQLGGAPQHGRALVERRGGPRSLRDRRGGRRPAHVVRAGQADPAQLGAGGHLAHRALTALRRDPLPDEDPAVPAFVVENPHRFSPHPPDAYRRDPRTVRTTATADRAKPVVSTA
jgi:hypothetical protein